MLASQMNWTVAYCRDWLRIDMMTGRTLKDVSSATPAPILPEKKFRQKMKPPMNK